MKNGSLFESEDFSPEINLARYLQSIRRFPILEPEEEYMLAKEYVKTKELQLKLLMFLLLRIQDSLQATQYCPLFREKAGRAKSFRRNCVSLVLMRI